MKKILNHSIDVLKGVTLGELADAYSIKLDTKADLMMLFEFILYDYDNDCYKLLYKEFEQEEIY